MKRSDPKSAGSDKEQLGAIGAIRSVGGGAIRKAMGPFPRRIGFLFYFLLAPQPTSKRVGHSIKQPGPAARITPITF